MIQTIECLPFSPTSSSSALDLPFRKQKLPRRCVWNWTVSGLPRWGASAPLWKKADFFHLNTSFLKSVRCFYPKLLEPYTSKFANKKKKKVYLAITLCKLHVELSELSSLLELWTTALQPVQKPIIRPLKSGFQIATHKSMGMKR